MIFIWSHLRSVYSQHREACLLCVQDTERLTRAGAGPGGFAESLGLLVLIPLNIHTPKIATLPLQGDKCNLPLKATLQRPLGAPRGAPWAPKPC